MKQELITMKKELPEGWRWVRLGDKEVSKIIMGQSPPSFTYNTEKKGLPFYQGKKDFGSHHPTPTVWCSEPKRIAEKGDILISVRAPVGPTNIANEKCCIGRGLAAIRAKVERDYLLFLLKYNVENLKKKGRGSTFDAINKDKLYDFKIILPPLPERQKIVSKLDRQMEQIEMMKREAEKEFDVVSQYIPSFLKYYFEADENNLPVGWKDLTLEQLVPNQKHAIKRGPFGGSITKDMFVESGYKIYEQKNAIKNNFGIGTYYINEHKFREMEAFEVKEDDLIISCSGTIGKVAIAPKNAEKGIINQALLKITLDKEKMLPEYFKFLFESEFIQNKLLKHTMGGAIKNVASVKVLKKITFPTPPIDEQKRKIEEIKESITKINLFEEGIETQLNAISQLPSSILNEVFGLYEIPEEV